jgi:hypothetical protein
VRHAEQRDALADHLVRHDRVRVVAQLLLGLAADPDRERRADAR